MTGPEHYQAAERLLAAVSQRIAGDDRNDWLHTPERRAELTAQAQAHATLALAAATAMTGIADTPIRDGIAWQDTAGVPREQDGGEQP